MKALPLSWSIINSNRSNSVTIDGWNLKWLAINTFTNESPIKLEKIIHADSDSIIRGCNLRTASLLESKGFSKFQFGMEAVLSTNKNHFNKKSINKLIKRGMKHGRIIKLPYNIKNAEKLKKFKEESVHGNEPQLANLFQTSFEEFHNLYVFVNETDKWLAAILVSENSREKLHTELLLRKPNAPVGIMEYLIAYIFNDARVNNYKQLSLGEVPFRYLQNSKNFIKNMLHEYSSLVLFAYNHQGLYNFKNKFQPDWNPLYICTRSKLKVKHLLFIFLHSNFHKLLFSKLIFRLKILFQNIFNKSFFFVTKKLDFNKT